MIALLKILFNSLVFLSFKAIIPNFNIIDTYVIFLSRIILYVHEIIGIKCVDFGKKDQLRISLFWHMLEEK